VVEEAPVFDGREEAVVEEDFYLGDFVDVVVLEAVDTGEEAFGGDGEGGPGVGDGCCHREDGGNEAGGEG